MKNLKCENVKNTASNFLDNLTDFLTDFEGLTGEELRLEVEAQGINAENLVLKVNNLVESKLKEAKTAWKVAAKQKRTFLLSLIESTNISVPSNISELKLNIQNMLSGGYGADTQNCAQAYFRNLEEITEQDLISLYEDLTKLEIIESSFKKDANSR
jgi:hypothetical protein